MTYVVAGVSGNTGKVVADTLLAQGKKVRVVVRDAKKGEPWKARGAEVAVADLADAVALAKALQGGQAAYLLVPPSFAPDFRGYQRSVIDAQIAALQASPVPHVVFLSSVGAQLEGGTGPITEIHGAELRLQALKDTKVSLLRAAYFMENLGGSLSMLGQGLLPSFFPADLAVPMVATADIGKLAAGLLVEGSKVHQVVQLAGPAVTQRQVADELSRILKKPITVSEAPTSVAATTLQGFGFPAQLAGLYQEMIEAIVAGRLVFEPGHRQVQGTTTLGEVLEKLLAAPAAH
ncbi:MAG: NmrA family NAD(P)-binding protein [Deltaproteobacteria bacterium]|nr:NmrA family NAD(P)-binding protein [Deltaproteobacteria bacterium]